MSESLVQLNNPVVRENVPMRLNDGGGSIAPESLGEVIEFSKLMARASVVIPKHLQNDVGACMAVTLMAMRWQMDPFAVASKSHVINGAMGYEAQLIAAVVLTRAPIKSEPDYSYSGEGATRRCKVSIEMKSGKVLEYETPEIGKIPTKNSPLWKSDPDQQLGYFAIRSWARRHAPQVLLGVYDRRDEPAGIEAGPDNARDVTPKPPLAERLALAKGGPATTSEQVEHEIHGSEAGQPPATDAPASASTPPADAGAPSEESEAALSSTAALLQRIEDAFAKAGDMDTLDAAYDEFGFALDKAGEEAWTEARRIYARHDARLSAEAEASVKEPDAIAHTMDPALEALAKRKASAGTKALNRWRGGLTREDDAAVAPIAGELDAIAAKADDDLVLNAMNAG